MSAAPQKQMSLAEFLAWEERQELHYEFDGFTPHAITDGTAAHDLITFNLRKVLDARLTGKPCQPWGPNMNIIVDGRARYPDAFVVCQPVPPTATIADNPVAVFEVVSEGSTSTDLIDKNQEYRATPSIQRYVILQQNRVAAVVFARRGQDWLSGIVAVPMESCDCRRSIWNCLWRRSTRTSSRRKSHPGLLNRARVTMDFTPSVTTNPTNHRTPRAISAGTTITY
jgi:Uma2 family endonuclease